MSTSDLAVPTAPADAARFASAIDHVLGRIDATPVGPTPFWHCFIEQILPDWLYQDLRALMLQKKHGGETQDRCQDSASFVNSRFNLTTSQHDSVVLFRSLFNDAAVKDRLFRKFYLDADSVSAACVIHKEFEFFFTKADRFQNIHVDIPPKCLSFVFYLPEFEVETQEAALNATVLYDQDLKPHHRARYISNSACIFAPHFTSYHGFSSTIDRDVLVMFYVDDGLLQQWRAVRKDPGDLAPFEGIRDAIENKLNLYPQRAFPTALEVRRHRQQCLINAPDGRVMRPNGDRVSG